MITRLTDGLVRRMLADPPQKDTALFDTELQRFALRIKPAASPKVREGNSDADTAAPPSSWFFVRYTAPDGRERRTKVGSPQTMPVAVARKAARAILQRVDAGHDPVAERARQRAVPTLAELADAYLAAEDHHRKARAVQISDQARIATHILAHIGDTKADAVTIEVARPLLRRITNDTRRNRKGRRLGGASAARKTIRLLVTVLAWGRREGLLKAVPFDLHDLQLGGENTRDAVITSPDVYARLFTTLDAMVADGSLRPTASVAFQVIACTGLRRGEAQALRWSQVDLERRQITLTATKGARLARSRGNRQSMVELVGIPPIAANALAAIRPPDASPDELVFPPRIGERIELARDWMRVRQRAGLPGDLTIHGLRHSVGTVAALSGMSMAELQALLRHRQPGTTARYIHFAQMAGGLADRAMSGVLPMPVSTKECAAADNAAAPIVPLHQARARQG
jgi:integrase